MNKSSQQQEENNMIDHLLFSSAPCPSAAEEGAEDEGEEEMARRFLFSFLLLLADRTFCTAAELNRVPLADSSFNSTSKAFRSCMTNNKKSNSTYNVMTDEQEHDT